uniref:Uncharacterized protein n=1 Tax=Aegilops tauschii subsp. strangulata TaxID=200361 RepID=A0A453BQ22_AEGTS
DEKAEAGAAATVRVHDQDGDRPPRGRIPLEEVRTEGRQEQSFPKVTYSYRPIHSLICTYVRPVENSTHYFLLRGKILHIICFVYMNDLHILAGRQSSWFCLKIHLHILTSSILDHAKNA